MSGPAHGFEREGGHGACAARKAELTLRLSEFEVPPLDDCLIIGKRAVIGAEGARRMAEAVAPGQYELLKVNHPAVEAVVVRASLLKALPQDRLVSLLVEEFARSATDRLALKARIHVVIHVRRGLELA